MKITKQDNHDNFVGGRLFKRSGKWKSEKIPEKEPEDGDIFYTGIFVLVFVIIINYIFYS